jgi:hypothetical protein
MGRRWQTRMTAPERAPIERREDAKAARRRTVPALCVGKTFETA